MESNIPEWARYMLAIAGVLLTLALTWIIAALTNIGKNQTAQGTNQQLMGQELRTVSDKVDNLHKWKNEQWKSELKDLIELAILRKEREDA